ncbi:MAG: DUF2804 domain-containing protein [Treponema sp.]|jgi:hypothetical protein|nr:DUF2804 domain-containing protein [Treponema sp.]
MKQREFKEPLYLLDEEGRPTNPGWAREDYFQLEPMFITSARRFFSCIDRYIIFSPKNIISFEIHDLGYIGGIWIAVFSLKDKHTLLYNALFPFTLGSFNMPSTSTKGSLKVKRKKMLLEFILIEKKGRIIRVDIPQFNHHRSLLGEVVLLKPPGAESLVTNTLWRDEKQAFSYVRCSPWFITEGVVQLGTNEIIFTRGNAWGIFHWLRRVRPRSDIRFWAAACGVNGGRHIALNVGYDSGDSSYGTENAFFLDGYLHKLEQVTFHLSPSNWLEPWRFTSNNKQLEMVFTPFDKVSEHMRFLFHIQNRRLLFGDFSGSVVLEDGSEWLFHNITGVAEYSRTHF